MSVRGPAAALLLALLLAGAAGRAQPARPSVTPLALGDAAAAAMASNPAIAGDQARGALAEARLAEARAAWLPRLAASESLVRSDNPVFVFGSLLQQGRFGSRHFDPAFLNHPGPLTNDRLAIDLRCTLFEPGRGNAVRQARNEVAQAGLAAEESRQRLRVDTIARYYGLAVAGARRDVAAEAVRAAEADAEAMRDKLAQGLLVDSDLLAAEVQAATLRQRLIEGEGEVAIARAALATLSGLPPEAPLEVPPAIPALDLASPPLDAAVAAALARRGDLLMARKAADSAALRVDAERGSRLPRADAFASYGASRGDGDRALGLVVAVDLFDPAHAARLAAAGAEVDAARAAEAAVRDRVRLEVVTAWHRAAAAHARIAVAAGSAASAEEATRIVRDRYDQGLTTITELLRAQTALVAARLDLLAARFDDLVGQAELRRATGGLADVRDFE